MIGIIFIGDLKYCPYLVKYTAALEAKEMSYEVLYWNREGNESRYPKNYIAFSKKSELNVHPLLKLKDFASFRVWLKKKITVRGYEKLIVLTTLSGMVIYDVLLKEFSNKYIFDVRDYSYEHFKIFYSIEKLLIKNSYFTCISSEGFKQFLPSGYDYVITHNFNKKELDHRRPFVKKPYGAILNLTWIGAIRYFDHQRKIIDRLSGDGRFRLIYHGSGPQLRVFMEYCEKKKLSNVIFTGGYDNNEKKALLHDADILNNSYQSKKTMEVKYAISNKYYDGLVFGIPQLVETGTFKSSIVKETGVGVALDPDDEYFADKLYDYYFSIDEKEINSNFEKEIKSVLMEDEEYEKRINTFLNR